MDELLTIVLTTVIAFMVTKGCQCIFEKLHQGKREKRRKR